MKRIKVQGMRRKSITLGMVMLTAGVCLAPVNAPAAPPAKAHISSPRYLPDTCSGFPISRVLWISPTQFIKLPRTGGGVTPILSATDIFTGAQTPLDEISAGIRKAWISGVDCAKPPAPGYSNPLPFDLYAMQVSPNERWLLWQSHSQGQPTWVAMTPDGTERREWPRHSHDGGIDSRVGWMRDSTHFMEVSEEASEGAWSIRAYVFSLETASVQEFPVELPQSRSQLSAYPNSFEIFCFPESNVLFTGDGRGWITGTDNRRYEIVPGPQMWSLREANLLTAATPLSGGSAADPSLSPSGNWIVWRDNRDGKAARTRINVSRPDGSQMQTVYSERGFLPVGSSASPQWTPDERGVTFYRNGEDMRGENEVNSVTEEGDNDSVSAVPESLRQFIRLIRPTVEKAAPAVILPSQNKNLKKPSTLSHYQEGIYLISVAQSEVCLPQLASRGMKRGLFPTTTTGTRETLLAKNVFH
jgi:hypothetical protein